nr:MAG TPA: hypothetical protein [Caudoviricetes sp.]
MTDRWGYKITKKFLIVQRAGVSCEFFEVQTRY